MAKIKGFTLLELMVVISLIGLISVSAIGLFFRSIRGTGKTQSIQIVDQNSQFALTTIERFIINARQVTDVSGAPCPNSGPSLTLLNADGFATTFSLSDDRIASNSDYISSDDVIISNLQFTCTTPAGAPDRITVSFDASHADTAGDVATSQSFTTSANLRTYQ